MKKEQIIKLTELYIKGFRKQDQSSIRKFLLGDEEKKEKKKKEYNGFISCFDDNEDIDAEDIAFAIKEAVIHETRGKTEALQKMRRFYEYLINMGVEVNIAAEDWPPIEDIGNRYERIIYILRETQTYVRNDGIKGENVTKFLADKLWVSERTIDEDFSHILPPEDEVAPKSIFQQSLAINGMRRAKGAVQYVSTAHPIFLIENLSSVLVMIEALLEKAKEPPFQEQAMITIRRIWKQLTVYAQDRIIDLLEDAYPQNSEELSLFKKMIEGINAEDNAFITEDGQHESPMGYIFEAMKMGKSCRIEYLANGWERSEWSGIIKGYHLQDEVLEIKEKKLKIPYKDIIMVTPLKNEAQLR